MMRRLCKQCSCFMLGRNGEESIPMLMMNHTDKEDSTPGMPPRSRPNASDVKNTPRLVEITSNPGTPLKVTEISGQYMHTFPSRSLYKNDFSPSVQFMFFCVWCCFCTSIRSSVLSFSLASELVPLSSAHSLKSLTYLLGCKFIDVQIRHYIDVYETDTVFTSVKACETYFWQDFGNCLK